MRKIELLAPVGDRLSFIGAINAGANAVYLAGKKFGARSFATNFEIEELIEMIEYAHLRNVLVYVTLNTIVYDDEIQELIEYADILVKNNVDAFIIQDLGILEIFSKRYPNTDLHASTQMNVLNAKQAQFLKKLGVKRIILARETSLEEVKFIQKNVDIELEVFVHGALCISYSGNCYFSSMIGQRSGNRGECAQSCRLPYELYKDDLLVEEKSYLLSAKDLSTLENIDQLIEAGVASIKIEGRMRKPEYVVQSVLSYRKAISNYYNEEINFKSEQENDLLKRTFNREQTKGYLFNEKPKNITNTNRPNHQGVSVGEVIGFNRGKVTVLLNDVLRVGDGIRFLGETDRGMTVSRIISNNKNVSTAFAGETVILDSKDLVDVNSKVVKTSDIDLENSLQKYFNEYFTPIFINGKIIANVNQSLTIEVSDDLGNQLIVKSDFIIPEALKQPLTKTNILEHFSKLGNTAFEWKSLSVVTDELGFIPIKIINELRREVIEKLYNLRVLRPERTIIQKLNFDQENVSYSPEVKMVAYVQTLEQLETAIELGIKEIYLDESLKIDELAYSNMTIFKKHLRIRPFGNYLKDKNVVISEVGYLSNKELNNFIVSDEYMNVNNIYAIHLLHNSGVKRITLSQELNQSLIKSISERYHDKFDVYPNLEKVVYGREELMISKYCPIAKTYDTNLGCNLCHQNQYYLKDRYGEMYPLINDGLCNIKILHSRPLVLIDFVKELIDNKINTLRLNFSVENKTETINIIKAFQNAIENKPYQLNIEKMTFGRFKK
ncbi:MAG: DUF3656 domain-containing protein [Candidatus Izemoplasmatales bacterium]|jgi:putative protease|nr:DUF3656 domain-containing protein [Candidatus Izemoplasmatales bacterium]